MYTKILLVGVVVIFMVACKNEEKKEPILTEPQMINALIQLYIAEERAAGTEISYDSIKKIFPHYQSRVFESLSINDSIFKESMSHYMNDPKKMQRLYTAVVDSLSLRAQELSATKKGNVTPQ